MQKRVLEVLKTWYFPYSAFWSAGQWGGAIARPPGYATVCKPVFSLVQQCKVAHNWVDYLKGVPAERPLMERIDAVD